ncbi:MAG: DEAD/DEAH box helicase, partial [Candidatus Methylomirabilia bacterium]
MADLRETIRRIWGYESLLPLQEEAMRAVVAGRDSVVVLPTGGGKSLCYQAPAAAQEKLAVVVSPLISLMKDQVDGLRQHGVAAACLNSAMSPDAKKATTSSTPGCPAPSSTISRRP